MQRIGCWGRNWPGWRQLLAAALWAVTLAGMAPAPGHASESHAALRDQWLQAPQSRTAPGVGNWNREKLLRQLLKLHDLVGMTRAQVIALLGQPGYSQLDYPGARRIDEYRLSLSNASDFRVEYDQDDKVTEDIIDSRACECLICKVDAPMLANTVLQPSGLLQREESYSSGPRMTLDGLDAKLGVPGKRESLQATAGGQVWLRYSEVWRIGGLSNSYFYVGGGVPLRTARLGKLGDKPAESLGVISYAHDCLGE